MYRGERSWSFLKNSDINCITAVIIGTPAVISCNCIIAVVEIFRFRWVRVAAPTHLDSCSSWNRFIAIDQQRQFQANHQFNFLMSSATRVSRNYSENARNMVGYIQKYFETPQNTLGMYSTISRGYSGYS